MVVSQLSRDDVKALYDEMSAKVRAKHVFRIIAPVDMTKEEKAAFRKAKDSVVKARKYKKKADENEEEKEARRAMNARRQERLQEKHNKESDQERKQRLEKHAAYMREYNQNLRETDPEKYKEQWKRSNAARSSSSSSSSSSPQYQECPKCTVMIEHTGGCELISCPCGIHFSFKFPEIHGEDKDLVAEDIQRNRTNLWMKQDRKKNPEKYKEKDKAKLAKRMEDDEKAEKERERHRLKSKRARENADPEQAVAYNRERREIKRQRLTDGFKKCPICDDVHQSRDSDYCREHRAQEKRIRKREEEVGKLLDQWGFIPVLKNRKGPCGDSKNLRQSDYALAAHDINYHVILEVDEDFHRSYTPECETARLADLRDQFPGKPLFFVRYGVKRRRSVYPSQCTISKKSQKELKHCLETIFTLPPPGKIELPCGYNMVFIGYPQDRIDLVTSTHERMQHQKMEELQKEKEIREKREYERLKKIRQRN
jgi:hypothetical protein